MGSLFGSSTIKGTRITEFSQTSATVGDPQPFGYGTAVFDGKVIFAALPPKEHVKKKRQGKGGVKQETYTYTMSYAIAFCAGPAHAIRWIKRNGKVVYTTDPAAPLEDRQYALKWRQRVAFHLGTETQLPDSVLEAVKGTGRVSAHRGVVYISVQDDDVTDGGGAVPSYEACITVSPPDIYVTSKPYDQFDASQFDTYLSSESLVLRQVAHTVYVDDSVDTAAEGRGLVLKDSFNKTIMEESTTPYMVAAALQVKQLQKSAAAVESTTPYTVGYSLSLRRVNVMAYTQMDSATPYMVPQGLTLT